MTHAQQAHEVNGAFADRGNFSQEVNSDFGGRK